MKRILNIAAAVLLAAAVLVSCDPGPAGLFALLEEEEPLDKGTAAFNANTAAFVTRLGAHYYAGVGSTILRRLAAGGAWETISDTGAPAGSIITAGVSDGTNLYVSYSPAAESIRYTNDGTTWNDYAVSGLPAGEPVQNLLFAGTQLFAVTQHSTGTSSSDYTTYYTILRDGGGGAFAGTGITDVACGYPSAAAWDGAAYWIVAGNAVFRGAAGALVSDTANVTTAGFTATNPVLGVFYDDALTGNDTVLAAATGKLWKLNTGGAYAASGVFGSSTRRLSSVIVVPKNGGGNATLVGVKSWASDEYTGYYEYDAALNAGVFSSVVPSSAYDMVSDNSNYVTTLDDLSIEGFYYDGVGQVLFARTVGGGLWSNTYSGGVWSGWDRE